ncbi:MAG TPA: hypothetical protein VF480_11485 [Verrucomicrobiae bacterium]
MINHPIGQAWFCPPGWKPGSTAGRDARRYIKQCCHARFDFGIRLYWCAIAAPEITPLAQQTVPKVSNCPDPAGIGKRGITFIFNAFCALARLALP